jgi:hypothetical protein
MDGPRRDRPVYEDTLGYAIYGDVESRSFRASDGSVAVVVTQSHRDQTVARVHAEGMICRQVDGVGDFRAETAEGTIVLDRDALAVLVFEPENGKT